MDKIEARSVLSEYMEDLKKKPYDELLQLISNPICVEVEGSSGAQYQIEYEALWDSDPNGLLRILASIDDGRLFTLAVTDSFLVDRDGTLST